MNTFFLGLWFKDLCSLSLDQDDDNNKQDDGRGNDYEASKLQGKIGDAFVTTCLFVSFILF